MLINETVGRFSPGFERDDHSAFSPSWQLSSDDWRTAKRVSSLLGGIARPERVASRERWSVITQSSSFPIMTDSVSDSRISFHLAEDRRIGTFAFSSRSQMLTAALARDFEAIPQRAFCRLSIVPIDFKTRNGILVRYLRPIVAIAE